MAQPQAVEKCGGRAAGLLRVICRCCQHEWCCTPSLSNLESSQRALSSNPTTLSVLSFIHTGTSHLAPALVTLDTNATLGAAAGSSGSTTRLSTPGTAMLALLLGQFPAAVVAPFWESLGVLPQSDLLRIGKDPAGSRLLEVALTVAPTEVRLFFVIRLKLCFEFLRLHIAQ